MKIFFNSAMLVISALIANPATARDRTAVPDAVASGKPVHCVQTTRIDSTRVHGDRVIDFHMRGGEVLRNTLPYACPSLGFEERFAYRTSTSELCSVDTITVLQSPGLSAGATCGLGEFQPVTLTKPGAKPVK